MLWLMVASLVLTVGMVIGVVLLVAHLVPPTRAWSMQQRALMGWWGHLRSMRP